MDFEDFEYDFGNDDSDEQWYADQIERQDNAQWERVEAFWRIQDRLSVC
jgi:hypothetical protein